MVDGVILDNIRDWKLHFRERFKVCPSFMDRMGELVALRYENFEYMMESDYFMLFAFTLYKVMNKRGQFNDEVSLLLEINKAAAAIESNYENRQELQMALEQEVLENDRYILIRKMYNFFNTNEDLNLVWINAINLGRSDQEMYNKNEKDCTSLSELQNYLFYKNSLRISNQEGYKDPERCPRKEVLKIDWRLLKRFLPTDKLCKAMAMYFCGVSASTFLSDYMDSYTWSWASTFRSDNKDFANFMDRMGDLAALTYENFRDLMRSSDSLMVLAFTLYKEMNYPGRSNDWAYLRLEIEKAAAVTVESETRKEELLKALEQEVSENGQEAQDQLIRKMYEFFNANIDLHCVWISTISFGSSDYVKDKIYLKSSDGQVYKMNKAAATSGSKVLEHVIEETDSRKSIPLPLHSSFIWQFIDLLEKRHDLCTSLQGYKIFVKEILCINSNKFEQNDEAYLRLEIEKAAVTVESETRKEELRKALKQEVSENGREQLIRKMYKFFNTNMDLYGVWMCTIPLGSSDYEDDTIFLDGVVYEMNKAAATSGSKVLKHVIEETGSRNPIPLPLHSSFQPQFIALLEKRHDLRTSLQGYKKLVKEFLYVNLNKIADWHRLFECLQIQTYSDLTSLCFCYLRLNVSLESKSRGAFSKCFEAFESNYKLFLQAVPYEGKHAISNLRRSAELADIPSLSEMKSDQVERRMGCTLDLISKRFVNLTLA